MNIPVNSPLQAFIRRVIKFAHAEKRRRFNLVLSCNHRVEVFIATDDPDHLPDQLLCYDCWREHKLIEATCADAFQNRGKSQ